MEESFGQTAKPKILRDEATISFGSSRLFSTAFGVPLPSKSTSNP
jgi:hypothetical protein